MEQEILKLLKEKKNTSLTSIEINDYLGLTSVSDYNELEKASLKAREKTRDKLNLLKKEISVFVNK